MVSTSSVGLGPSVYVARANPLSGMGDTSARAVPPLPSTASTTAAPHVTVRIRPHPPEAASLPGIASGRKGGSAAGSDQALVVRLDAGGRVHALVRRRLDRTLSRLGAAA